MKKLEWLEVFLRLTVGVVLLPVYLLGALLYQSGTVIQQASLLIEELYFLVVFGDKKENLFK